MYVTCLRVLCIWVATGAHPLFLLCFRFRLSLEVDVWFNVELNSVNVHIVSLTEHS